MDKSWINLSNRLSDEYWWCTDEFMEVAARHTNSEGEIRCPRTKCVNHEWLKLNRVESRIIDNRFNSNYTLWIYLDENDVVSQRVILIVS